MLISDLLEISNDGFFWNMVSSVAASNYGNFFVQNPAARNTLFELGHPQMHSLLEVVRIFEQAGTKAFELQFVPASALEAQRDATTDPLQITFAAMMHNMATGIHADSSLAQKAFPDIKLKSVPEFASQALVVAPPR